MQTTGMKQDTELLALHQTTLMTWLVRRLGNALLYAAIAVLVADVALGAAGAGNGGLVAAVAVGFLAFALYLAWAAAPPPPTVDDGDI